MSGDSKELYAWATSQIEKPATPDVQNKIILLGAQYIVAPFAVGYGVGVKLFNSFVLDRLKSSPGRTLLVRLGMPMSLGAIVVMATERLFLANIEALKKANLDQNLLDSPVPQDNK